MADAVLTISRKSTYIWTKNEAKNYSTSKISAILFYVQNLDITYLRQVSGFSEVVNVTIHEAVKGYNTYMGEEWTNLISIYGTSHSNFNDML